MNGVADSNPSTARTVWRRLARVRLIDVGQLVVLAGVMLFIEPSLRLRGVERSAATLRVRFLDDSPPGAGIGPDASLTRHESRWISNAKRIVRRWPLDRSCLRRSLLVGWVLRSRMPQLVIGTRLGPRGIEAHAWIRLGGIDLDAEADTYAVFGARAEESLQ